MFLRKRALQPSVGHCEDGASSRQSWKMNLVFSDAFPHAIAKFVPSQSSPSHVSDGVCVAVGVCVDVAFEVGVEVGVFVDVAVEVEVGVCVDVPVGVRVDSARRPVQ